SVTLYPLSIEGEPGTGKELAARKIHGDDPRRLKGFIHVDCRSLGNATIPNESWVQDNAFQSARRGTLFLKNIEHLSENLQAALLRRLDQEKTEMRIITSTSMNLGQQVDLGRFNPVLHSRL